MSFNAKCLTCVTVFLGLLSSCGQPTKRPHALGGSVPRANAARLERDIRTLAAFGTRHTLSVTDHPTRGIGAARRWLHGELENISREHHGGRLQVTSPSTTVGATRRTPNGAEIVNVVALLPGSEPRRIVAVSGHYDSRCSDPLDGEKDAPGANDDASGTALVLECARLLGGATPRATIAFVCVAGEEQGLLGSKALADAWLAQGLEIEAFISCDIVGGARGSNGRLEPHKVRLFSEGVPVAGPKIVGSDNDAPSRQLARYLEEVSERETPGFDVELVFRQDRFLRGGDHRPFNELGLAAVRLTEPNENYAQQHQDVRVENGVQFGDLPEFVDFAYVARVSDVCATGLRELASAPAPPRDVRMAAAELSPDTRLDWTLAEGVAEYRVRLRRTAEPTWTHALEFGRVDGATLAGYSKDDWLFAVQALDERGHASTPVYPQVAAPPRP